MMFFHYNLLAKGDIIEVVFLIAFIAISAIGSVIKASKESKEKKKSLERIKSSAKSFESQKANSKPAEKSRPRHLPYAKGQFGRQQTSRPRPVLKPTGSQVKGDQRSSIQRLAERAEQVYDRPSEVTERNALDQMNKQLRIQQKLQQQKLLASQILKKNAKKQEEQVVYDSKPQDQQVFVSDSIKNILSDKQSLRSAVLLSEILGKPVSMREI